MIAGYSNKGSVTTLKTIGSFNYF